MGATKMTTKVAKIHSFTVNSTDPNALVPLDEKDEDKKIFSAVITISQGWPWLIERTSLCSKQTTNGRIAFDVNIEYLDGPNKGKIKSGTVTDFDPAGRYGKIQKK